MKRIARGLALLVPLFAGAFAFGPGAVERHLNPVGGPPPRVSEGARELHRRLLVADLHADSLLWGRDLLVRGSRGHVDLPRLIEGNVALQGFSVVTKTPRGLNYARNGGDSDDITLLALAQRWPPRTWRSLKERALYQAARLHDMAARSDGRLVVVESATDLAAYLERRRHAPALAAGLLSIEGAHCLEGDLDTIDAFFAAGFRMVAPTHFFDNELGGSAHGLLKGGITEKGREMIRRMEARGMVLDLAHASPALFADALSVARKPVVVSHTGVKATCDNARNLSDDQIRAVARTGGVVGIGYWDTAVCGTDARAVARAIRHAIDVAGVEHVGIGSDFDGAVSTPFDTAGVAAVTDALLQAGLGEADVRAVMGGNVLRLLGETLPERVTTGR